MIVSLFSCQKRSQLDAVSIGSSEINSLQKAKELTSAILLAAKSNPDFIKYVYKECYKQKDGDYNVKISDLIEANKTERFWNDVVESKISNTNSELYGLKGRNPIIFVPSLENHPEKVLNPFPNGRIGSLYQLLGVLEDEYDADSLTCPGYVIDVNSNLVFVQNVNEPFAWENDLWVIGYAENTSTENTTAAPADTGIIKRTQGGAEYGGIIQVTNLGAIEPWVAGKLEFRYIVTNSSGAIIKDRKFGKWRRSNFKDQKWKDFGDFIGYWNTGTFGNWMSEKWIEKDGGNSNSISYSIPPPPGQTGPTTTITIPSKNKDDDLGVSVVQFTDPISTVYNISYANFKRRN